MRKGRREFLRTGAGAAVGLSAPSWMAGCCPCTLRTTHEWNNAVAIGGVDPSVIERPASLAELSEIVRRAGAEGSRVRMVGAGHSFSDVAFTDDFLLMPDGLNRPLPLDRTGLKAKYLNDTYLVRVESGMRVRDLNAHLWAQGLALPIMGGYDAQTVVGATATGTHGSSLEYGPIGDMIVSFQLVTTGGKVLQIEPTDGITDPGKFPRRVDTPEGPVPAELVQDDRKFRALSVGLGCMGVVYSVTARVEPKYWLAERRRSLSWGEVKAGFLSRLLARIPTPGQPYHPEPLEPGEDEPTYYEIYFNPYPSKAGGPKDSHRCILTERVKLLADPTPLTPKEKERGRFGMLVTDIMAELTDHGELLVDYMNHNPKAVPGLIDQALEGLVDDRYVGRSYEVFNLGPANKVRAYAAEMAFDIRQTVQATERLMDDAAVLARDGKRHSSPPSLRFVKRSDASLAMMQGRETTMMEIGMIVCADGGDDLLRHYELMYMRDFGARPHWGLDLDVLDDYAKVRTLYPDTADDWLAVFHELNAAGTFDGAFTDRLRISKRS